jgi:hypothetical protein
MSAVAQLIAAGVQVEALSDGKLRASGNLTDTTRALIRANKQQILAELAAKDSSAHPRFQWLVLTPRGRRQVRFWPMATLADVQRFYPGADAEPLSDQPELDKTTDTGSPLIP